MKFKWNKVVATLVFLLTAGCLVVSIIMTRQSGVSSAATAEGKQLLGWASVLIHLGMPTFGVASGAFNSKGMKGIGFCCVILVVLCAFFSITNVLNFVAAERTAIARAEQREHTAKMERDKAALEAQKRHADTVNEMAKSQLKWYQGTGKDADGRREKKDAADGAAKFILDYAKTEVPLPNAAPAPAKDAVSVSSEDGVKMLSEWTGWNTSVLQLSNTLQTVLMLIIFEAFGWTIAAYLWFLDTVTPMVTSAATGTAATVLAGVPKTKLLPPPRPRAKTVTIRTEPSPEWRHLLDLIDFPPAGARHKGPPRAKHDADTSALRFMTWLGAYGERGEYHTTQVDQFYEEFTIADHREPTGLRVLKPALESLKGKIATKWQVPGEGTFWELQPPTLEKMKALLEKADMIEPGSPPPAPPAAAEPQPDTPGGTQGKRALEAFAPFWRREDGGLPN